MSTARFLGRGLALASVTILVSAAQGQTTWYVDGANACPGTGTQGNPFCGIQTGINAAVNGDTVIVFDGTYTGPGNRNLNFGGRLITLQSVSGSGACIIDCQGAGRGFIFVSGETADAVVDGFTVRNGSSGFTGAGMNISNNSNPTITNCTFTANAAPFGAGMYNSGSSPTVINCTFSGNASGALGGGMINTVSSNATVTNCAFSGNTADLGGGMLNDNSSSPTVTNCTFRGNAAVDGGGILNNHSSNPTVANSILWDNTPNQIVDMASFTTVTYSDVQNGWPGVGNIVAGPMFVDPLGPDGIPGTEDDDLHLLAGSPCIDDADNTAVPPDTFDLDGDGDTTEQIPLDLDGNPRFADDPSTSDCQQAPGTCGVPPIVDMGAHESQDCNQNGVLDVDDIANGTSEDCDGNGVPDECQEDCNANGVLDSCDIAVGTSEDCNTNGVPDECDVATGTSEDCNVNGVPDECDPDCNQNGVADDCDITGGASEDCDTNGVPDECDVDCNGNGVPDACEASVVFHVDDDAPNDPAPGDPSVSDPNEDGSPDHPYDAIQEAIGFSPCVGSATVIAHPGTYNELINFNGKTITLRSSDGAGVTTIDGGGVGSVVTCASGEGPGTVLEGFTITGGSHYRGGGMNNDGGSSPTVTNCTFRGNTATIGSGMYNNDNSSPTVTNCTFSGNTSSLLAGGMRNDNSSSPTVTNCTFCGNSAVNGGGILNNHNSNPVVANSILWDNTPNQIVDMASVTTVTYSDVQNGWPGAGNVNADPLFVDAAGVDGLSGTEDDDLHLSWASPAIDAGDNAAVTVATDLDGNDRIMDGDSDLIAIVDMGVYEQLPGCASASDCGDTDGGGVTDNVCTWWECNANACNGVVKAEPSDMGGEFGACEADGFCNVHDRNHALNCFSGTNACETVNIDAGGAFGVCPPDGFCNIHDANHALTCFGGMNPCSCPGGPTPEYRPVVVDYAGLTLAPSRRTARPGETVEVRVFINEPLTALQSYQLHVGTSGGRRGRLDLIDIAIEDRKDFAFDASPDVFDAYNVANSQMLAGLDAGSMAMTERAYLATFTYRVSPNAVGTFVVDVLHDEPNQDQTFLVGVEQTDKIEIALTQAAVITVINGDLRSTR